MIEYEDRIYGKIIIKEPIILEIINSETFQNLKELNQIGLPDSLNIAFNFSKYEHSVGVYILLNKLGAPLKAQIIGLLHDISHTAYFYTINFKNENSSKKNNFDTNHYNFIYNSEINQILIKFGYSSKEISNLEQCQLVKSKIPSLNADRIDYALREISYYLNKKVAKSIAKNIFLEKDNFFFRNKNSAKLFGELFIKATNYFESKDMIIRIYFFSILLKLALKKEILTKEDFNFNDKFVFNKILNSKDKEVSYFYKIMLKENFYEFSQNMSDFQIKYTFRYCIPKYKDFKENHNLDSFDKDFKEIIIKEKKKRLDGIKFNLKNEFLQELFSKYKLF